MKIFNLGGDEWDRKREVLSGWVLGQLADRDEEVARAEPTATDLALHGLASLT